LNLNYYHFVLNLIFQTQSHHWSVFDLKKNQQKDYLVADHTK